MSRTAVVVVNYNGVEDLERCIDSLLEAQEPPLLVVADNASTFGDAGEVVAHYPGAKLIRSPENVGFGRGNNLGIRWALANTDCEFVMLLNNDALVEPGAISKLEAALDAYPKAGIAVPRIVMAGNPDVLWYGGGEVDWRKGSGRVSGYLGFAEAAPALEAREVGFASGCAMMIRCSLLKEVGGFDPRFFMYEEDLELCLRVREADWSIRYVPEALILHKGQGVAREGKEAFTPILSPQNPRLPFYVFHIAKNRPLTMMLHARRRNALRFAVFFPAFLALRCFEYALHGRWDAVRSVFLGLREFVLHVREPYRDELR